MAPRAGRGGRRACRGRRAAGAPAPAAAPGTRRGRRTRRRRPAAASTCARCGSAGRRTRPARRRVGDRAQRAAHLLRAAGVERRIDVDEVERAVGQQRQHGEVVALDEEVVVERERDRGPRRLPGRRHGAATSVARHASTGRCATVGVAMLPVAAVVAAHRRRRRPSSSLLGRRGRRAGPQRLAPGAAARDARPVRLRRRPPARTSRRRAAAGLCPRPVRKSPGGVVATAERVARAAPAVVEGVGRRHRLRRRHARGASSSSRARGAPTRWPRDDLRGAVGLTQILAETGQRPARHARRRGGAAERLTRRIARAERRGRRARARARARAPAVDERFDPAKALAGDGALPDVRRRTSSAATTSRSSSYHMGVGNLQRVADRLRRGGHPLRRSSSSTRRPLRHARGVAASSPALGDDSSTYLWRVARGGGHHAPLPRGPRARSRRARRACTREGLRRGGPAPDERHDRALRRRPRRSTTALDERRADARCAPSSCAPHGLRIDRAHGRAGAAARAAAPLYRALHPDALALLRLPRRAGEGDRRRSRAARRDEHRRATRATSGRCTGRNIEATHGYSLHTTGYAFDVARTLPLAPARRRRSSSCSTA